MTQPSAEECWEPPNREEVTRVVSQQDVGPLEQGGVECLFVFLSVVVNPFLRATLGSCTLQTGCSNW